MELSAALCGRSRLPIVDGAKLRVAWLDSAGAFHGARAFPPQRWSMLENFSPNILAGSVSQLQRLLERISLQTVNASAVDHSVFVTTQLGDPPLDSRFRERLWRQFNVPVYEIYVDERYRLLAYECEAAEGWHVQRGVRFNAAYGELLLERGSRTIRTGLNWVTEDSPCPCGRAGLRLVYPPHAAAVDQLWAVNG